MLGAAVSMYIPRDNSIYVQVLGAPPKISVCGAGADMLQHDSVYSLLALDLTTGKESAVYAVCYSGEQVKLLSVMYDDITGKTYGFIHVKWPIDPTQVKLFFGYLDFSQPGQATFN